MSNFGTELASANGFRDYNIVKGPIQGDYSTLDRSDAKLRIRETFRRGISDESAYVAGVVAAKEYRVFVRSDGRLPGILIEPLDEGPVDAVEFLDELLGSFEDALIEDGLQESVD
ncbi:MAG: hypothetical protein ACXWLH_02635 [Candidatus Saccharimonadales bacterium]